ncbi:MAG: (2Fe-2S)-binding protein [Myxococcales bacterium]|nr:(2Fe-2S)-binding protein [Myxococcales bacterium]
MTDPSTTPKTTTGLQVLHCTVNGDPVHAAAPANETILEVLRYRLGYTGSKQGCDKGDCGACTILVEGRPVLGCLTLGHLCEGKQIETVEGLAGPEGLHPVQDAFNRYGAAQCGFCTPGMLMAAVEFLRTRTPDMPIPSRPEVAHALSGNLCRCTGYVKILDAVVDAAERMAPERKKVSGETGG